MRSAITTVKTPLLRRVATPLALAAMLACAGATAEVSSETIYFLQPDGRSYLLERALRTDAGSHRFHVDKSVGLDDLRHVDPQQFTWDDRSSGDANLMEFASGGFTVIFPGRFDDARISRGADGVAVYRSWDGSKDAEGRFGMWYAPGDFDRFTYTWILPDNITLLGYSANRDGEWVERANAVSFYAYDVNNLTFEIRYRVDPVRVATAPAADTTVAKALPAAPAQTPCEDDCNGDSDGDGVHNGRDLCRNTPAGARTDRAGCSLDTDRDGVADGIDSCPATADGARVDARGCPLAEP